MSIDVRAGRRGTKKRNQAGTNSDDERVSPVHRVRLPGFLIEKEIGLGDVIKRATWSIGITPCTGCEKRAAALNRWMKFSR
jgi:hypothetical protein